MRMLFLLLGTCTASAYTPLCTKMTSPSFAEVTASCIAVGLPGNTSMIAIPSPQSLETSIRSIVNSNREYLERNRRLVDFKYFDGEVLHDNGEIREWFLATQTK